MTCAYICGAVRTPFAYIGGSLSAYALDQLAALPLREMTRRNPFLDWSAIDKLTLGCAGVESDADKAQLLGLALEGAGLPASISGQIIDRELCSGLDAVGIAANDVVAGTAELIIAGGVGSAAEETEREAARQEAQLKKNGSVDGPSSRRCFEGGCYRVQKVSNLPIKQARSQGLTDNYRISPEVLESYTLFSWRRRRRASEKGYFDRECMLIRENNADNRLSYFSEDELFCACDERGELNPLRPVASQAERPAIGSFAPAAEGACTLLLASPAAAERYGLIPRVKVRAYAQAQGETLRPGAVDAIRSVLAQTSLNIDDMDYIELSENCAAETLAVMQELGLAQGADHINTNGSDLSLGDAMGASGARLVVTAVNQLESGGGRYALCAASSAGLGSAIILEKV